MGKTRSTTTVQAPQIPAPTAAQTRSEALQMALLQRQLQDLGLQEVPGEGGAISLQRVPGGLAADEARVRQIFGTAQTEGEEDIARFARELAGRRGMNLTDSPIGGEVLREQQKLVRGLGSAESAAMLDLPQRALQNQLALMGGSQAFLQSLQAQRLGQMGQTQTQTSSGGNFGSNLGGIGGLLGGLGTAMPFFSGLGSLFGSAVPSQVLLAGGGAFSSARFKEALTPVSEREHEAALAAVRDMPLYHWRYRKGVPGTDQEQHLGPITEQAPKEIVTEDKLRMKFIDALGLTFSAVKALDRKVEKLEEKLV